MNKVLVASIVSFSVVAVAQGLAIRSLTRRTDEIERHQRANAETVRAMSETVREANGTLGRIQRTLAAERAARQATSTNCDAAMALVKAEKALRESKGLLDGNDGGSGC